MKKIAILASGEGTNAEKKLFGILEKRTAEVALVISTKHRPVYSSELKD